MQKSERFSPVCARDVPSGVAAGYFRGAVFFRYDGYGFEIIEQRKTGRSARYATEQSVINAKAPNTHARAISAACFFGETENAYAQTRIHSHASTYTHARTRVHAYIRHTK